MGLTVVHQSAALLQLILNTANRVLSFFLASVEILSIFHVVRYAFHVTFSLLFKVLYRVYIHKHNVCHSCLLLLGFEFNCMHSEQFLNNRSLILSLVPLCRWCTFMEWESPTVGSEGAASLLVLNIIHTEGGIRKTMRKKLTIC